MNHEQWNAFPYKFYYSGDVRWNKGMSQVSHYRMSENFVYQARPFIDLEVHYSYIYNKASDACRFNNASRFELEINPHFSLNEAVFRFRNRMEFIKRHKEAAWQYVFRQKNFFKISCKRDLLYYVNWHEQRILF
ncbi:MAG TPA: hypothetical protein PLC42_04135 [Parachlamydiaceae bacterium]|nr:hypothetical protein [Parachlamydiaceae bacterium]